MQIKQSSDRRTFAEQGLKCVYEDAKRVKQIRNEYAYEPSQDFDRIDLDGSGSL